ncbi:MAG: T9SS type A sorting domain-containing protein [Chitinophagales bacterium]|nr:T9SS type A sorting domain-containing protein [Chitinophagales bacterium]
MKKIFTIIVCVISVGNIFSQERLSNLTYNYVLLHQDQQRTGTRDIGLTRDTLCLPFLDDFSNLNVFLDSINTTCGDTVYNTNRSEVYPNNLFWTDSNAYINRTYPILPPTYGVATLDGLDKSGRPHNEGVEYGAADTLTSKPVFLGGTLTGTVYLSFYYQPGGYGDFPEEKDSLILEFRTADSLWHKIWETTNTQGEVNQAFKIEMIEVSATEYLYDGFQFRFRNWASIFGNNDHWHLDYVYLDEDRTIGDTIFRDVSFVNYPSSYLKNYRQMPWNQYKDHQEEEKNSEIEIQIVNNYNDTVNTSYRYTAYEKYSQEEISSTIAISINFEPYSTFFTPYSTFAIPSTVSGYDEDSLTVTYEYILDPSSDVYRVNDTLYYDQSFYNYFAYDDGTAERAYDLTGIGSQLAIEFFANEPDTLKEVYIHWAYVTGSNGNLFFSLIIWDDIDTTLATGDGTVLYQADFLTPKYVDSVNGFYVYQLVDFLGNPTPVVVDGHFYVGWLQTQGDPLQVGFDKNNIANEYVYFNTGGFWQKPILPGAIMIRPQVGGDYSIYSGIENRPYPVYHGADQIEVFPNPASGILYFEPGFNAVDYFVYDYAGKIIMENTLTGNFIPVSALMPGFYILKIHDREGRVFISKFIKE